MTDTNPPADRKAEIHARLDAALSAPPRDTLRGHTEVINARYMLEQHAVPDIAWLLAELDKAHRRNELLTSAKNHATEQRDKHARRVVEWREAADRAAAERDAARDVVRDFNNRLEHKEARVEELERQLAAVDAVHKPKRLYTTDDGEGSWSTAEQCADDCEVPLDQVKHFDICEACGDMETHDDEWRSYRDSMWPCETARARGIEAGR